MPRLRNPTPILDFCDLAPGRNLPGSMHERLFQVNNSYRVPISNLVYIIDNQLITYHLIGSTWKVRIYRTDHTFYDSMFDIRYTKRNQWDRTYNLSTASGKIIIFASSNPITFTMGDIQRELLTIYLHGVTNNRMIEGREICQD